jgi:hypothetical protein
MGQAKKKSKAFSLIEGMISLLLAGILFVIIQQSITLLCSLQKNIESHSQQNTGKNILYLTRIFHQVDFDLGPIVLDKEHNTFTFHFCPDGEELFDHKALKGVLKVDNKRFVCNKYDANDTLVQSIPLFAKKEWVKFKLFGFLKTDKGQVFTTIEQLDETTPFIPIALRISLSDICFDLELPLSVEDDHLLELHLS